MLPVLAGSAAALLFTTLALSLRAGRMHAHSAALGDARALFAPPGAPPLHFTPASLSAAPPLSPPAGGGWGATLRRAGVFRADRGAAPPPSADDAAVRRRICFAFAAPAVRSGATR